MDRNRIIIIITTLLWGITQGFWLHSDHLIRDGDEEGHIGAAELFHDILLENGFWTWLSQAWCGDFGEYPPLFASLLGAWWSLFPFAPEHPVIRSFGSVLILGTAFFIARLVWRLKGNWELAFTATLLLPLLNGVGRHFMPEILLSFMMAGFAMMLVEESESPSIHNKILLGVIGGLGLLTKQSFLLLAPILALGFLFSKRLPLRSILPSVLLTIGIASPWYLQQFPKQNQYIQGSIQNNMSIDWLAHILFYPSVILLIGWGLIGTIIFFLLLFKNRAQKIPTWAWVWAIAGLLIMILLPKKYPRLLLAWLPLLGIFLGLLGKRFSTKQTLLVSALLFLQFISLSFMPNISVPFQAKIDNGCPQYWLRPPSNSDFQLRRIRDIVAANPEKSIAVLGDVSIDCQSQSTHNWTYHLDPYLRRHGLNTQINFLNEKNSIWKEAQIQIQWKTMIANDDPNDLLIKIRH
jgi:hypothetical protein